MIENSFSFLLAILMMASGPGRKEQAGSSGIPDRPEKLSFPTLIYEPPTPESFRVRLKNGPVAYVVPDSQLPLVNVVVYVHAGQYLEPDNKSGLSDLTGYLLARGGTRSKTAEELEEQLAFLAAQLDSEVGETQGSITLNLLSKDLDQGLGILREVLTAPRFQEDKISLRKQQMTQAMKERNDDSSSIEEREEDFLALGEKFWANRYPTAASIASIAREDLEKFHQQWFHPSNFVVAASGDFDRDKMVSRLETLFADWPFRGQAPPPIPTNTVFASPGAYLVDKEVNQGRVTMMLPGIKRDDPDYFPGLLMNDIFGGGELTSRLVNRVRSDEGLAYDAHSSFPGGIYYPLQFSVAFQSKSRTVAYAAAVTIEELKRMSSEKVTREELDVTRRGFIERFPRRFSTKTQIAATFAEDEFTGRYAREPDYWKKYRSRVEAVTQNDILRVTKKYLVTDKLVILVVGQKSEIQMGHPEHKVKLTDLAVGHITDLPLRDPLTMQPIKRPQTQ